MFARLADNLVRFAWRRMSVNGRLDFMERHNTYEDCKTFSRLNLKLFDKTVNFWGR